LLRTTFNLSQLNLAELLRYVSLGVYLARARDTPSGAADSTWDFSLWLCLHFKEIWAGKGPKKYDCITLHTFREKCWPELQTQKIIIQRMREAVCSYTLHNLRSARLVDKRLNIDGGLNPSNLL